MTVREFNELINMFNKGDEFHNYTDEELYEIGVAHKSLPMKDKNWSNLARMLQPLNKDGEVMSGEQFRQWVLRRQSKEPQTHKTLSGKKLAVNSDAELVETVDTQIQRLYIQEKKMRDAANMYRRLVTDSARLDEFKDTIKDTVELLNELPQIQPLALVPNVSKEKEAVLMMSDLHIGVTTSNFYNTYNIEIAAKRVSKLVEDTIKYCKMFRITTLHVLNLGDMIHGLIHISARLEQQVDTVQQVMIASEIIAQALNRLQEAAPRVTYRSCSDNHSRIIADKSQHVEKDNMGRLIDWYLAERLKNSSIEFVHDNLDYGMGFFTLANGKKVVFAHGHLDNINTVFQNFVGATRECIDYALLAHYHSEKLKTFQGLKVFVNGSIVGTEQYALSKRLFNKPSQILLVFDNDNVLDVSIELDINE